MFCDEFVEKFGQEVSEQEYTTNIEPMYMAAKCNKYVFMMQNYENICPSIKDFKPIQIYQIKFRNPKCHYSNSIVAKFHKKESVKRIGQILKTYHGRYICENDLKRFQQYLTSFFRNGNLVDEFKYKPIIVNCNKSLQVVFYCEGLNKKNTTGDYNSIFSNYYLEFEKL